LFFPLASFPMNIHLTLNTFRIKYLNNVRALKRNLTLNKEILMATKKKAKKKATKKKATKKKATKKKATKKLRKKQQRKKLRKKQQRKKLRKKLRKKQNGEDSLTLNCFADYRIVSAPKNIFTPS